MSLIIDRPTFSIKIIDKLKYLKGATSGATSEFNFTGETVSIQITSGIGLPKSIRIKFVSVTKPDVQISDIFIKDNTVDEFNRIKESLLSMMQNEEERETARNLFSKMVGGASKRKTSKKISKKISKKKTSKTLKKKTSKIVKKKTTKKTSKK